VYAHIRPDSGQKSSLTPKFEAMGAVVDHTPWEENQLAERLKDIQPSLVFALLGTTKARGRSARKAGRSETYESIDRDLSLCAYRASIQAGSNPRFVYLSSMGAQTPGGNRYLKARKAVETKLMEGSLPWTIARPAFITGADRQDNRPLERIGAIFSDGVLGGMGALGFEKLATNFRSMDATALAEGLVFWALEPAGENQIITPVELRLKKRA